MKQVYIETFGCQMNEYDSEQMRQILSQEGFEPTTEAAKANLILINSCSVREKSETKALSFLGRLAELKKADRSKVIGFGGCVGQTDGKKLLKQFHFLDFAFGTNNYRELPAMLEPYKKNWANEENSAAEMDSLLPSSRPDSKSQAFITITNGCDKFCSYCIVPFTRGREFSRSPEEILAEAQSLIQRGVREIMLLGQNVNSYWGVNRQGAFTSLYDLLVLFQKESEASLKGLERLRYTTSHPRDFDENLARAYRELPILCEYLHLPFQSGSDSILRKMRRFYTADQYLKKIEMVRTFRPDIALSTDIIVGFPGETRADFEATLKVVRDVEFDNIYSFVYSPRPYTRSEQWIDDVPAQEKKDRMSELLVLQRQFSKKKYSEDIGNIVEIMLEAPSKGDIAYWTGRTRKNRVVHIPTSPNYKNGQLLLAKIESATHSWMRGEALPSNIHSLKALA